MPIILQPAYAEQTDMSGSSLGIVLLCAGLIAIAVVLALLPIGFSRNRRNRRADMIAAAAVLWCLLAAGTLIDVTLAQIKWSNEYLARIRSGYYDPQDTTDAPHQPLLLWAILVIAYIALLLWSRSKSNLPMATRENDDC